MKNQSRYKSISYPSYSLLHNTYNRTQSNVLSANTSTLKQNKPQNTAGLLSPSKARIGFQTAHTHTHRRISKKMIWNRWAWPYKTMIKAHQTLKCCNFKDLENL